MTINCFPAITNVEQHTNCNECFKHYKLFISINIVSNALFKKFSCKVANVGV